VREGSQHSVLLLQVQKANHLTAADFPDPEKFAETMSAFDLSKMPKVTDRSLKAVDAALTEDLPAIIKAFSCPY
jgi:Domain of unknown function (DUF5600)